MNPLLLLLAQTPALPVDQMVPAAWVTGFVVAVIGAVYGGMKVGQSRKVQVGPQPFEVDVRKAYVTREECLACKIESKADLREMRSLYEKTVVLFQTSNERLSDQIKVLAENTQLRFQDAAVEAAERRRRIHDKLNEHADLLSRIDARTDVSKSIGKLGAAIVTLAKKEN